MKQPSHDESAILDDLIAECILAEEAGQRVDRQDLLKRHPLLAEELKAFFEDRDRFRRLASPLATEASRRCDLPAQIRYFGDYELLEEIAHGGMGVVYKARQTSLNRIVAVKMILSGHLASEDDVRRFTTEAETSARLKHKGIVPIHEVGQQNGQHYFSMDFIKGRNLAELIRTESLTPKDAARLVQSIAEAVHYAHDEGIVHRDLKPSNILVDDAGQIHITDFGLALRVEGGSELTRTGQILGTPSYMSPEQASAKRDLVGPASDIYSLGAILYELLTGRPPFRGETALETIQQVLDTEPIPPTNLNPQTPRDLETICSKCLDKEPHQRYGTAALFSDDVARYLAGEPIHARRVRRIERAVRWCRREPMVASLLGIVAVLLVAVAGVSTAGYFKSSKLLVRAIEGESAAKARLDENVRLQGSLSELKDGIADSEKTQFRLEQEIQQKAEDLKLGNRRLYRSLMKLARAEWLAGNVRSADFYLESCPTENRGREWKKLKHLCRPNVTRFDGKTCVAISPDGRFLAAAGDRNSIKVWELNSRKLRHTLYGHSQPPAILKFSPDGQTLASAGADRHVLLWDLASGRLGRTFMEHAREVTDVDFSPDGKTLVSADFAQVRRTRTSEGRILVWDAATGNLIREIPGDTKAAYSPNGRYLATWSRQGSYEIHVREVAKAGLISDEVLLKIAASARTKFVFSPDGSRIAVSSPRDHMPTIDIWHVEAKTQERRLQVGSDIQCLAYSSDGRRLAVGNNSENLSSAAIQGVGIVSLVTGERERALPWYSHAVSGVAFHPRGHRLATADADEIKVWDVTPSADPTETILATIRKMNVRPGDWPQWGGSGSRINTPSGTAIPIDWDIGTKVKWEKNDPIQPERSRNIKWTVRLGSQTYGNPVVANGRIFVGTNNGASYLKKYPADVDLGVLLCFEEETGRFLWQHSNDKLPTGRVHDWPLQGVCSTPVVDGDRLWYVTNRGEVVCLDTEGFYDGQDDGVDDTQTHLFGQYTRIRNQDVIPAALRQGRLHDVLRAKFKVRGISLPEDVKVEQGRTEKEWTFEIIEEGKPRRFHLSLKKLVGREYLNVSTAPYRLDRNEADVVWRFNMMTELGVSPHNMSNCSMATADGMLFVCTSNGLDETHLNLPAPEAPSFMAMDRNTGKVLWTDSSPGKNILHAQWASPSYAVFDGVPQVIFAGGDGWVYSFDPKGDGKGNAKLLWKFDANPKTSKWILGGNGNRNNVIAFPAIYDGLVYIVCGQDPEHGEGKGHLWCLDPLTRLDGGDVSSELAYDANGDLLPHRRIQAVDVTKGEMAIPNPDSAVRWHYQSQDQNGDGRIDFDEEFHRSISIPVIKDDILYISDFSGLFHCLNAKTGKVYWTYDMFAAAWGSPLLVDGHVYMCDEDGDVAVFRHSADPQIAMRIHPDGPDDFGNKGVPINADAKGVELNMDAPIYMSPIVANNVLYIATRNQLYAITPGGE